MGEGLNSDDPDGRGGDFCKASIGHYIKCVIVLGGDFCVASIGHHIKCVMFCRQKISSKTILLQGYDDCPPN